MQYLQPHRRPLMFYQPTLQLKINWQPPRQPGPSGKRWAVLKILAPPHNTPNGMPLHTKVRYYFLMQRNALTINGMVLLT